MSLALWELTVPASLVRLSEDVLLVVGKACYDPLAPTTLAYLAAVSHDFHTVLQPKVQVLKAFCISLRMLCARTDYDLSSLSTTHYLNWNMRKLTTTDLALLGRLMRQGLLMSLAKLNLGNNQIDGEGLVALLDGLHKDSLDRLEDLSLYSNQIGDEGIRALSTIMANTALANLRSLALDNNQISDASMCAFSSAIAACAAQPYFPLPQPEPNR